MNMWDWLMSCYSEGELTLEELEEVMKDDKKAKALCSDWWDDTSDLIELVRREVEYFLFFQSIKKKD